LSKKPLFTFLETEIVRAFKKYVMSPPAVMIDGFIVGKNDSEESKKKALDSLML